MNRLVLQLSMSFAAVLLSVGHMCASYIKGLYVILLLSTV